MPLRAQRPAPPPPSATRQPQTKTNLNSSLRKITASDTNNNQQNVVFSRPTVIRPSTTNKPLNKKKPPPRPAPPKNYQTSRQPADNLTSSTPDLLADLRDIFSCPPQTTANQKPATSVKPVNYRPASAFFSTPNQASASFPFRPAKKYQAPVPSASKKNSGEVSLIDFDSPVITARITPSNMVAMAATANQHKALLDWGNQEPQRSSLHIPKSSSFDLLSGNNPFGHPSSSLGVNQSFSSHHMSSIQNNPAAGLVQQRATSFATQHKETVINWGVSSVKDQVARREFSPPEPKFPPPPPPPICEASEQILVIDVCGALFDFTAENSDELSLRVGDNVEVELKQNTDWWTGRCGDQRGVFPASFVQSLSSKPEALQDQAKTTDGCFAKAVSTFIAEESTDLPFQEGDVVQVLYRINQDWLFGSCQGRQGQFPANFVQKINSTSAAPSVQSLCQAIYAFKAENADELNLKEGDRIVISEKSSADWWKGRLERDSAGREGLFPAAFVETL